MAGFGHSRFVCPLDRVCKFSMFANDTFNELAAVAGGRRPKAIADEFSEFVPS